MRRISLHLMFLSPCRYDARNQANVSSLQGYLSFWNDNISYALRGCILIELALRRRIATIQDPARRRYPLPDRLIEVIDTRQTGETILDEALKMIQTTEEKMGVGAWIDLMSGERGNSHLHFPYLFSPTDTYR